MNRMLLKINALAILLMAIIFIQCNTKEGSSSDQDEIKNQQVNFVNTTTPITDQMIELAKEGNGDHKLEWEFFARTLKGLKNDEEEVNIDEENHANKNYTSLHYAAELGDIAIIKALLDRGANVDVRSEKYIGTPLHIAAKRGHIEIVKILLAAGASNKEIGKYKETPLHSAVGGGNVEIVELLLNNGADVDAKDKYGRTHLHTAVDKGHIEIVKLLLKTVASKDEKLYKCGSTPLHIAAKNSSGKEIIQLLIDAGANQEVRDNNDKPYIFYAAKHGMIGAQYQLALLYASGAMNVGPLKKYTKSKYWVEKAAATGRVDARQLLEELNKNDIKEIQREQSYIDEQNRPESLNLYAKQKGEKKLAKQKLQEVRKTAQEEREKEPIPSLIKERKKENRLKVEKDRNKAQLEAKERKKETKGKAEESMQEVVEHGSAQEQYTLALKYEHGKGEKRDAQKAAELFEKAAQQGHAEAQYKLGLLYKKGYASIKKDINQEIYWYEKAADQGHVGAKDVLELIYKKYKKEVK